MLVVLLVIFDCVLALLITHTYVARDNPHFSLLVVVTMQIRSTRMFHGC